MVAHPKKNTVFEFFVSFALNFGEFRIAFLPLFDVVTEALSTGSGSVGHFRPSLNEVKD